MTLTNNKLRPSQSFTKRTKHSKIIIQRKRRPFRVSKFPADIQNPRKLLIEKRTVFLAKFQDHDMVMKVYSYRSKREVAKYYNEIRFINFMHPNIQPIAFHGSFRPNKDPYTHYFYTLTPYHKNGTLFDLLNPEVRLSEDIIRTMFLNICEGLKLLHMNGYAHMNLSISKILIDSNFCPKIYNFETSLGAGYRMTSLKGTKSYRAPETLAGNYGNPMAADMYSLGVILYAMRCRTLPFDECSNDFKDLRKIFDQNPSEFFKKKFKHVRVSLSEMFKELFTGMVQLDFNKRWNMDQVTQSRWAQSQADGLNYKS